MDMAAPKESTEIVPVRKFRDTIRRGRDHSNYMPEILREKFTELDGKMFIGGQTDNDWGMMHVRFSVDEGFAGGFQLQQLPGCCAIMTLSYVQLREDTQENFSRIVKIVEDAARDGAFAMLMLSQVYHGNLKNEPWGNLPKEGFKMSAPALNAKSFNNVVLLTKDLKQESFHTHAND